MIPRSRLRLAAFFVALAAAVSAFGGTVLPRFATSGAPDTLVAPVDATRSHRAAEHRRGCPHDERRTSSNYLHRT